MAETIVVGYMTRGLQPLVVVRVQKNVQNDGFTPNASDLLRYILAVIAIAYDLYPNKAH